MKTHLFLFTIGPVQGFISQARKAHDLHSGSKLLSDFCRVAATHFKNVHDGEIIFPDISSESIPNRFLGLITCEEAQLFSIGKSVADAVREDWKRKFDELLAELLGENVYEEAARQIDQHLDIQWLFQTIVDDSDETYRQAYDVLNKNLNALKNTRPFQTSEEVGRKCSLDGERNVIFYRLTKDQVIRSDDKAPLYSTSNLVIDYNDKSKLKLRHLQPGEGLSAVSMLKRCEGFGFGDFPSTAQFALADIIKAVRSVPEGERAFWEMVEHFGGKEEELNWQVFYEENLNDHYFKKQGLDVSVTTAKEIRSKIDNVARGLEKCRRLEKEKYYACVVFDGDNMGEWWKGSQLKDGVLLRDFHRKLTTQLAEFAKRVRAKYPNGDHRGWVIYAGGDDFLGFFNLHHLVDGLDFLRDEYRKIVHEPLAEYIRDDQELTFSAGVCIAHYKEPLSLVLAQAHEMEHESKKFDNDRKNAIGISVIPGSGQIAKAILHFENFPNFGNVISNLQGGDFSNAFVSKARTELAAFIENDGKLIPDLLPAAKSLLDRAVSRACNLTRGEAESEEEFQKRKSDMVRPLQSAVKALLDANLNNLGAFFDALDIADFIERQTHTSLSKSEPVDA